MSRTILSAVAAVALVGAGQAWYAGRAKPEPASEKQAPVKTAKELLEEQEREQIRRIKLEFLASLKASYVKAVEDHYVPAKNDGEWFRAYEIAGKIYAACRAKTAFNVSALENIRSNPPEEFYSPEGVHTGTIDWKAHSEMEALSVTACMSVLDAERGALR